MQIQKDVFLKEFNTWKVGGNAELYISPKSQNELEKAYTWGLENEHQIHILSGGSNVLISDSGLKGLVIHTAQLEKIESKIENGHLKVVADCGAKKSEVMRVFLKHRLDPALFLAGLPGDVGGGVVMNAGVSEKLVPREFVEIVEWVEVIKVRVRKIYLRDDLEWSYRHCNGWQPGVISKVGLDWPLKENEEILKLVREANKRRLSKQPLEWPSCGSVFVNPEGYKSGKLIEDSGLKGFKIGGAMVSEKHANFIINCGDARAQDIHELIFHVQKVVEKKFGVKLTTEVVFMGNF